MSTVEFEFNVPAELLHNNATNYYITVKAQKVGSRVLVNVEMNCFMIGAFKSPMQAMLLIEKAANEVIETGIVPAERAEYSYCV